MKRKLIIFGTGDFAEVADYYFTRDSQYSVVAFVLDSEFIKEEKFKSRPVLDLETAALRFSPAGTELFVAIGYSELNAARERKCVLGKQKGYRLASYISSRVHNLELPHCGEHCFILEANTIQPFVSIGENVVIWSGNHIGHHTRIGSHCFISSHVVIGGRATVGEYCFLGTNCSIRDHVTVKARSIIGSGVTITKDTEEESVYGSPQADLRRVPSSRVRI